MDIDYLANTIDVPEIFDSDELDYRKHKYILRYWNISSYLSAGWIR